MKKLVYSALALTLTGVPALATDNGWSGLDKEIESLSSSLQSASPNAPSLGGWIQTSYRESSDTSPDTSGFQFDSLRLQIEGDAGNDYSYKVSMDLSTGTAVLKDAYVKWRIYEGITGKIGRSKEQMVRSATVADNRLILLDRTLIGELLGVRELGASVNGAFDVVNWTLQAQDGSDGQADKHRFIARVTANVVGKGGENKNEGAYGAGDETNVMVGVAYQDDGTLDNGTVFAVEGSLTAGPFSASAELADFDSGDSGTWLIDGFNVANTSPWDVTVSYLITPEYELAGRYEDADDANNSTAYTFGVNRYVRGHDIKWTAQWVSVNSDAGDFDELGVGLGVSF